MLVQRVSLRRLVAKVWEEKNWTVFEQACEKEDYAGGGDGDDDEVDVVD